MRRDEMRCFILGVFEFDASFCSGNGDDDGYGGVFFFFFLVGHSLSACDKKA